MFENKELIREWDFEKNSALGLDPQKLKTRSNKKVWWRCSECGKEYSASWGIGFNFPRVYIKCLLAVKKGKYGSKWKELYLNNQYVAVNADTHVYLCKKCGYWVVEEDLSLYIPNNL